VITKPTVLVLGAGASEPYSFPLGAGLIDQVCSEILDGTNPQLATHLEKLGHTANRIREFATDLREARPYSIDAFLELRHEFLEIGKAAIADVLLRAETSSPLLKAPPDVDWYRHLLNKVLLLRNQDYFRRQVRGLTVVTFNFDRSLERALFVGVRSGLGMTDEDARQLVTELQIHHVHGVLGQPDWLYPHSEDATSFGMPGDESQIIRTLRKAVRRIKIVHEEIDAATLEDIEVRLKRASYVYFLGFGFDERNLEKLGIPDSVKNASQVRGTALHWSKLEQFPVHRAFARTELQLYSSADAIGFLKREAEALYM
jgi:hypothetical protein